VIRERLKPEERRARILDAALGVAERQGYHTLRQREVAAAARCSMSLIHWHWGGLPEMRAAVLARAIEVQHLPVVLQGLAMRDPVALCAPEELRRAALEAPQC
jgi:AcrR family transcriptional regulator